MALEEFENSPNTLIILDEIQESYIVYNSIRTLQESLDCHIAVTGSYLGKVLNAKYFKPAGNVYEIEMLPLSFAEFCRAFDAEKELLDIDLYGRGEGAVYHQLTELYKVYRQIGGYPAVVTEYIKTQCLEDCFEIIRSIINRFTEESASYFEDDKCSVIFQNVYKAAFLSMTKEKKGTASKEIRDITDFVKTDTKEHVSRGEVNKAISWLKYSKIIGSCDLYNQGDVPCCSGYQNYELDFMIVDKNDVKYGIEVKTSDSDNPKSLNAYLSNKLIDQAYLAGIIRGGIRERIKAIPVYTVGCRFPYD